VLEPEVTAGIATLSQIHDICKDMDVRAHQVREVCLLPPVCPTTPSTVNKPPAKWNFHRANIRRDVIPRPTRLIQRDASTDIIETGEWRFDRGSANWADRLFRGRQTAHSTRNREQRRTLAELGLAHKCTKKFAHRQRVDACSISGCPSRICD